MNEQPTHKPHQTRIEAQPTSAMKRPKVGCTTFQEKGSQKKRKRHRPSTNAMKQYTWGAIFSTIDKTNENTEF